MAIFCLSRDLDDLRARLGNIVVGLTRQREPVRASAVNADGAMTALLKDALAPNLLQTLENNPALIHGGPFANIAHGCNSVIATRAALKLADYVVTEAGFGADLGAEKFFDIKCRKAGLAPDCAVIVATIRALKMHGGVARSDLGAENLEALATGMENLARHVRNVQGYGVPAVVAINRFSADTEAERALVAERCAEMGVKAVECDHWGHGRRRLRGAGARGGGHDRGDAVRLPAPLSGRDAALGEDRDRGAAYLRRRGHHGGRGGAPPARRLAERRLRALPRLHGQDAVQLLGRRGAPQRAERFRGAGARGAALRRCRVRGGDLRRDHDHAGPAAHAAADSIAVDENGHITGLF